MGEQELYRKYAGYYDLIYRWMDYSGEADFIKKTVLHHKKSGGNELLDVACGTGGHALFLQDDFQILGVDINPEMLDLAREKLPRVNFIQSDMRNLNLGLKFDVIICLFSAINYHKSLEELKKTFQSFYQHLHKGGVLLFDLGFCLENWEEGRMLVDAVVEGNLQLARISQSRLQDGVFNANFVFLIKEDGKIDFEVDQHQIGVFPTMDVQEILYEIGFECYIYNGYHEEAWDPDSEERPVFVCVKE